MSDNIKTLIGFLAGAVFILAMIFVVVAGNEKATMFRREIACLTGGGDWVSENCIH